MKKIIYTCTSRTEVFKFIELLKASGVQYSIITTPKEAGSGCGISLSISYEDYSRGMMIGSSGGINFTSLLVAERVFAKSAYRWVYRRI